MNISTSTLLVDQVGVAVSTSRSLVSSLKNFLFYLEVVLGYYPALIEQELCDRGWSPFIYIYIHIHIYICI